MKLVLLAAGRGTRISRYLEGRPKCTVDIGGQPLIEYTIDLFNKNGIDDIAIVLGYEGHYIKEALEGKNVKFYYNPFYDVTNSVASIWFAKDFFEPADDVLIMNADVFLEQKTLDIVLAEKKSPVLFSDDTRKEESDYKFYYENDILIKHGKELTGDDITGEYVGIAKLSKDFLPEFLHRLEILIDSQQHGLWWENILYSMIEEQPIHVRNVAPNFWGEVDYIEDYERIMAFIKK